MQLRNLVPATSRTVRTVVGGTALVAVVGGTVAFTALDKDVTVDADGARTELSVFGGTVADVLQAQDIEVGPHDIVAPSPDTDVTDGTTVVVRYGRQVTLTLDGQQQTYWTTARTVDEALADLDVRADGAKLSASRSQPLGRQGLALDVVTPKAAVVVADGQERPVTTTATDVAALLAETAVTVRPGDEVSVDTAMRVTPDLRVQVVRVDRSQSTEQVAIAHGSRTEGTDELFRGERRVAVQGVDGSKTVTFDDVSRDGVRVTHDAVGETVDVQPVEEVVQVGTKEKPKP
ncbi:ubiquitin-like domain-containing protein, partial [Kineococcus indalonis]|uniref:ubiquitin-like domain-containing protein n=1 Tax=Kineococcus indalonis TaxID=2696566 RepID=UPI00141369AA